MGDKTLLSYRGNLDITDIPGALTGSKNIQLTKYTGRDYINVHDIAGAIPKLNVGYTGHRRFDEGQSQGSSLGRNEGYHELIGRPKLKQRDDPYQIKKQPMIQQGYFSSNNYQIPHGQQLDSNQIYQSLLKEQQKQQQQNSDHNEPSSRKVNFQDAQKTVPELNLQKMSPPASNDGYQDTLDQFLSGRQSENKRYSSNKQRPKESILQQIQHEDLNSRGNQNSFLSKNGYLIDQNKEQTQLLESKITLPSGGFLTQRNNPAAKSTANLILNKQPEDQFIQSLVEKRKQKSRLELSPGQESPANQVQKKIKDVQSSLQVGDLEAEQPLALTQRKNKNLFNINSSTLPESGMYNVRQSQAQVVRALSLLPNTQMGANHKQEIDEEISHREYTKLGGTHLGVQMPSEVNNIQYHRKNHMKDMTYNSMTGSYNFTLN